VNFKEWKVVVDVVEKYQPDTVSTIMFNRFATPWIPSYCDGERRVYKQTLLTMKRKDEEAKIVLETVEVDKKEIERAIYLESTSYEKTVVSASEVRA
jgi:uncharacterized protein (UPF0276 family)